VIDILFGRDRFGWTVLVGSAAALLWWFS
jgi:hypothetical protein